MRSYVVLRSYVVFGKLAIFLDLVLESHIGIPEDPESIYHAVDCVDCAAKSELDGALNQAATCTCIHVVRFVLAWR